MDELDKLIEDLKNNPKGYFIIKWISPGGFVSYGLELSDYVLREGETVDYYSPSYVVCNNVLFNMMRLLK